MLFQILTYLFIFRLIPRYVGLNYGIITSSLNKLDPLNPRCSSCIDTISGGSVLDEFFADAVYQLRSIGGQVEKFCLNDHMSVEITRVLKTWSFWSAPEDYCFQV
jgi:hypothetical protein